MNKVNNIVLAIVLIAALSSVASAAELHVGAGEEYSTIQDAVKVAPSKAVIVVHAGTYSENVEIKKRALTLQGAGADLVTVEAADATGSVFHVTADYVNISGFTVTGATGGDWGTGISIGSRSDHCNISCNQISGNRYGIVVGYANNRPDNSRNSTYNTIAGNKIIYNENGIYLTGSIGNNITCNLVQNNLVSGIHLTSNSTGNVIEHNNIIENGVYNRVTPGWEWNLHNGQSDSVTVKHNYWGTTYPEVIAASIREDSGSVVDYISFETEACTCTPAPATTAPASITNLDNTTYEETFINWTWEDPEDDDFSHVMIYINGTGPVNVTNGTKFYNATGLSPDTGHEITTRTVDTSGNVNTTWVIHTAWTKPAPDIISEADEAELHVGTGMEHTTVASTL